MTKFCVQCGAAIPAGSSFCSACGQPVDTAHPGTAPAGSPATPIAVITPSGPGRILSGRGAAAIAVLAVLGGAAALFTVAGGQEGGATSDGRTTTTYQYPGGSSPPPTQPEPPDPRQVNRPGQVGSGSLADLVEERPGRFVLAGTDRNAEIVSGAGANDAIVMRYEYPGGTLVHALLAYGSAGDADSALSRFVNEVAAEGGYKIEGGTLSIDGEELGKVVTLRREEETVVWTHGPLLAIAIAPQPYAMEFLDAVQY